MSNLLLADDEARHVEVRRTELERLRELQEQAKALAPRRHRRRWRCTRQACDGEPHKGRPWKHARSSQIVPIDDFRLYYLVGGRGSGKTWAGANNFAQLILDTAPDDGDDHTEWAVIAPTYRDARDVCIEGPSGLIRAFGGYERQGGLVAKWDRTYGHLRLTTGALIYVDSANDGALRVQGKNLYGAWCDEVGLWKTWRRSWHESLMPAVRKGRARVITTGTPKLSSLAKVLLDDPKVGRTRLRTIDNLSNLSEEAVTDLLERYEGTRLGQQELEGLLVDDVEGALWKRAVIDRYRVTTHVECSASHGLGTDVEHWHRSDGTWLSLPRFWRRIVVALDPSDGTETSDEQGLAVIGQSATDFELYVLESEGLRLSPFDFLSHALDVAVKWGATITVEKNHGALYMVDLLEQVFMARSERVPVHVVNADSKSGGKRTRAEAVSGMWERGKVHHVDTLATVEDQMCTWTGLPGPGRKYEPSPDRMDALVWAAKEWEGERLEPAKGNAGQVHRWAGQTSPQLTVPTGRPRQARPETDSQELPTIRW